MNLCVFWSCIYIIFSPLRGTSTCFVFRGGFIWHELVKYLEQPLKKLAMSVRQFNHSLSQSPCIPRKISPEKVNISCLYLPLLKKQQEKLWKIYLNLCLVLAQHFLLGTRRGLKYFIPASYYLWSVKREWRFFQENWKFNHIIWYLQW